MSGIEREKHTFLLSRNHRQSEHNGNGAVRIQTLFETTHSMCRMDDSALSIEQGVKNTKSFLIQINDMTVNIMDIV